MTTYVAIPDDESVVAVKNPRAVVRAFAVACVLNTPAPNESQVKWIESQAEPYDGSQFWVPYGQFQGSVYMKPWAIGLLRYLPPQPMSFEHLARIDPYSFYHDFLDKIQSVDRFGYMHNYAAEAWWLATPEGARAANDEAWANSLELLYTEIRIAGNAGTLKTNPRVIKRMLA